MKLLPRWYKAVFIAFLSTLTLLSGCSTNVDNYKDLMKQTETELKNKTWETRISVTEKKFQEKDVASYFKEDNLGKKYLTNLNKELQTIKTSLDGLKKLEDAETNSLNSLAADNEAKAIQSAKIKINKIINDTNSEILFVREFYTKSVPKIVEYSTSELQGLDAASDKFSETAEKALKNHKNREKDIFEIIEIVKTNLDEIKHLNKRSLEIKKDGLTISNKEMKELHTLFLKARGINYVEYVNSLGSKLKELDTTYVRILKGKEAEYAAQVNGVTWDDYSDWNTEENVSFPEVQISEQAYKKYKNGYSVTSEWERSFRDNQHLKILTGNRITNFKMPRGNDRGDFWTEDVYGEFYHQYDVIENGKVTTTDWLPVSEQEYFKYYNSVGMTIYSKPYGMFNDEANEVSKPVGASMVGNPEYGEWRKDPNTGENVWFWIAMWSMMNNYNTPAYYERDYRSYDRYRRADNSYYSSSSSSRTNNTVSSSRYSYSGVKTANARVKQRTYTPKPTVRNNSKSNMSRGSGKGGK